MKKNFIYIITAILVVILLVMFFTRETFTGITMDTFAEYPQIFLDKIAQPFSREIQTTDMYKTIFSAQPFMPQINQLNIESQIRTVMIDIGNGTSVEAPVHIPAQTIENIQEQRVIKYVEPKDTDVLVAAQVVQLPEQEGIITAQVNENKDYIEIPVMVPSQTVVIPEQTAMETTAEKFHI